MSRPALLEFLRAHRFAVVASIGPEGEPQAALVGYAVTGELELVFDTSDRSRKFANLQARPRVAAVIGEGEATLQYEGVAEILIGEALEALKPTYFAAFPDGRERESWPDIAYVLVRPRWLRLTDFGASPPAVLELDVD